jgi:hypothetical protein
MIIIPFVCDSLYEFDRMINSADYHAIPIFAKGGAGHSTAFILQKKAANSVDSLIAQMYDIDLLPRLSVPVVAHDSCVFFIDIVVVGRRTLYNIWGNEDRKFMTHLLQQECRFACD